MKILFCIPLFLLFYFPVFSQSFIITPEFPISGEQLILQFDPENSLFQKADILEALVYVNERSSTPEVIVLEKNNDVFKGFYNAPKNAKAILIYLFNRKLKLPTPSTREHFRYFFYEEDGKTLVKEVYLSMYKLLQNYNRLDFISQTNPYDFSLLKKELETNPSIKDTTDFLLLYFTGGILLEDKAVTSKAKKWLKNFQKKKEVSEEEFFIAQNIAAHLNDYKTERSIIKKGSKSYSKLKAQHLFNKFNRSYYSHEQIKFYKKLKKVEGDKPVLADICAASLAKSYQEIGHWKKIEKYIAEIKNPRLKASTINEIVKGTHSKKNLINAKSLSALSLKLMVNEIKTHQKEPKEYVFGDKKERLTKTLAQYTGTFAYLEFLSGNYHNALILQEKVCEEMDFENAKMNENYCRYLASVKGVEATQEKLEKFISSGHFTLTMENMLEIIIIAKNEDFEPYLYNLRFPSKDEFRRNLKAKMISEFSPNFKLKNLEKEPITLKNLKGKIVVLNFWETWSPQSRASLLAVEKIKNKFQSDPDVQFLFINTGELIKASNYPVYEAKNYLELKKLDLNVFIDFEQTVFRMYQGKSLPTRIIIDKEGLIRFKSIGFDGDKTKLKYELINMIELLKEE